jgi:hypothetical protein
LIAAGYGFWKARTYQAWLLLIPVMVVTLIHVAYFSNPRFTVTVEPFVVILAVAALLSVRLETKKPKPEHLSEFS